MVEGSSNDGKLNRLSAVVDNFSDRFYFAEQNRNFTQYSHIYNARLIAMRNSLLEAARRSWGEAFSSICVYILRTYTTVLIWIEWISRETLKPHNLNFNDSDSDINCNSLI